MIKTTLTKLKKAYSTLSFAPRAFGVESNGKFYKLIVSLMRRAEKRTKPDNKEEEVKRNEVIAKLMLAPPRTDALIFKDMSNPEALQKSSILAPPVETVQREKSTLSKQDGSNQNDPNSPVCEKVAVTMPKQDTHTIKESEPRVSNEALSDTGTHRQKTIVGETMKKFDPPNSLQNAIPDFVIDESISNDGKTNISNLGSTRNNYGKILNIHKNTKPVEINIFKSKGGLRSAQPTVRIERDNDLSPIKLFASYDKTKKPPSTETNTTFDELAKHCLDSPNNKIDERLLKEMKKLGVPQTGPRRENSVIEENIIQMDVLRKPRKPAEKTEIDVETRKFEHPPLNYSDEQRLEFDPSTIEEEEDMLEGIRKNPMMLASQFCNIQPPTFDDNKPLLNPFDKRNININDEGNYGVNEDTLKHVHRDVKKSNVNKVTAVQLEKTNKPLEYFQINSQSYSQKTDTPLEYHKLLENKTGNDTRNNEPIKNFNDFQPENKQKLSKVLEDNVNNGKIDTKPYNPKTVHFQAEGELNFTEQSENIVDKITVNSTSFQNVNRVNFQPEGEQDLTEQSENIVDKITMNSTSLKNPSTVNFQPETELDLTKQSDNSADKIAANLTSLKSPSTVNFQPETELDLANQSANTADEITVNSTSIKSPSIVHFQPKGKPGLAKQSEKLADKIKINSTPLNHPDQVKGKLEYSKQSKNIAEKLVNHESVERHTLENNLYDHGPKIPEPVMVFNPPEKQSPDISVFTNKIEYPRANDDLQIDPHVANVTLVQNLKSLRIRCNVLPMQPTDEKATIQLLVQIDAIKQPETVFAKAHHADVTYREDSTNDQQQRRNQNPCLENVERITRDKVTLILPLKREAPTEKPEIPLSEMLKRVRLRNRVEHCQQLEKTLKQDLNAVEYATNMPEYGKCGDKPRRCPPPQKRCPRPACPPSAPPSCPPPCLPSCPPPCPPPCPRPCKPSRQAPARSPCCPGSPHTTNSPSRKNPCCPGSSSHTTNSPSRNNPCCPGSSSHTTNSPSKKNPCCPKCNFSTHLPTYMMNSIVSLIHQRVTITEWELAQNHFFMVTKDAYLRLLSSGYFAEIYRPRLLPIMHICGFDSSFFDYESLNNVFTRNYDPWVPIPCWPVPKKEVKKPLVCPKDGCPISLPHKTKPECNPYPCRGFPKRKNAFSIIDLYESWSRQYHRT